MRRGVAAVAAALTLTGAGVAHADARPLAPKPIISEDDPRWDCRTMGNRQCGVRVEGTWYVIAFDRSGKPVSVRTR
jgi:hypothetical protein